MVECSLSIGLWAHTQGALQCALTKSGKAEQGRSSAKRFQEDRRLKQFNSCKMLADRQFKSIVIELHPHTGLPRGRSVHNVCVSVYIRRSVSLPLSLCQRLSGPDSGYPRMVSRLCDTDCLLTQSAEHAARSVCCCSAHFVCVARLAITDRHRLS